MQSKILIDIDNKGVPVIRIDSKAVGTLTSSEPQDVRDKLIKNFLGKGSFCWIHRSRNVPVFTLHSMNSLDVLKEINISYHGLSDDESEIKEFEQAIFKVASFIEKYTSERSSDFTAFAEAQALLKG